MGIQQSEPRLFYVGIQLDDRIPADHPLRLMKQMIDFTFARDEVAALYGHNGNVSIDPVVILKLLVLLFLDDIKSERELMRQLAYRMDYLWFLDFDLDAPIPHHSVLSKARARWGRQLFETLFVRTVVQCVEAGLVDGTKLHMDATLVDADASKDSVVKGSPQLIARLRQLYRHQEGKLDHLQGDAEGETAGEPSTGADDSPDPVERVNEGMFASTDPDAAIVRQGNRDSRPRYKHHRSVDDAHGVITGVDTSGGDVDEGQHLIPLIEQHEQNTGVKVETVVADSKYGTIENFLACEAHGIRPHLVDLQSKQKCSGRRKGIFPRSDFVYDAVSNTYQCPGGETLYPRRFQKQRSSWDYVTKRGVCQECPLRARCTRSKTGRSIKRHQHQDQLDRARAQSRSARGRRDQRRRKHVMEGSFAQGANCHHIKRSRWRGLWRQRIQDLLIAAVQNIKILIARTGGPLKRAAALGVSRTRQDAFRTPLNALTCLPAVGERV